MDHFIIAGKPYSSRLLVGTGKYKDFDETRRAMGGANTPSAIHVFEAGQVKPRCLGRPSFS